MPKRRPSTGPVVAGVEQQQLADPPGGDERAARRVPTWRPARSRPRLQVPGVGRVGPRRSSGRALAARPAVDLDLEDLGHGAVAQASSRGEGRDGSRRPGRRGARGRPTPGSCPGRCPRRRSSSGGRFTWVVDAGWVTSVSGPPSDVASWRDAASDSTKRAPASRPPARSKVSRPPVERIWRLARSCWGCEARPG